MTDLTLRDPGPMARFEEMIADATTMSVIVQRLTDGETLKDIAKSRQVPYGKLAEWIIADTGRAEQYARASRIWVDALARANVKTAADVPLTKADIAKAKLIIDTNFRIASKLDRGTYGDSAAVNVNLGGALALPDREQMVLETARAFAYVMAAGAQIADQRGKLIEHEPNAAAVAAPTSADPPTADAAQPAAPREDLI